MSYHATVAPIPMRKRDDSYEDYDGLSSSSESASPLGSLGGFSKDEDGNPRASETFSRSRDVGSRNSHRYHHSLSHESFSGGDSFRPSFERNEGAFFEAGNFSARYAVKEAYYREEIENLRNPDDPNITFNVRDSNPVQLKGGFKEIFPMSPDYKPEKRPERKNPYANHTRRHSNLTAGLREEKERRDEIRRASVSEVPGEEGDEFGGHGYGGHGHSNRHSHREHSHHDHRVHHRASPTSFRY